MTTLTPEARAKNLLRACKIAAEQLERTPPRVGYAHSLLTHIIPMNLQELLDSGDDPSDDG